MGIHTQTPEASRITDVSGFGPRFIPARQSAGLVEHSATISLPKIVVGDDPMSFAASGRQREGWQLEQGLSALAATKCVETDWFSIEQPTGALVGTGIDNFIAAISSVRSRYATHGRLSDGGASIVYVADLVDPYDYLVLDGRVTDDSASVRVSARFLTDGYPVDAQRYRSVATALGFTGLDNARPCEISQGHVPVSAVLPVVEHVVETDLRSQGDPTRDPLQVGGLIVENPLREELTHLEGLEWTNIRSGNSHELTTTFLEYHEHPRYLYCQLPGPYSLSDLGEVRLRSLTITGLGPLLPQSLAWNLSANVVC